MVVESPETGTLTYPTVYGAGGAYGGVYVPSEVGWHRFTIAGSSLSFVRNGMFYVHTSGVIAD
jgi:hypothetical protein